MDKNFLTQSKPLILFCLCLVCVILVFNLSSFYSASTSSFGLTKGQSLSGKCLGINPPIRVAYINGHDGTSFDFSYLAAHAHFNFSEFHPGLFDDNSKEDFGADHLNNNKLGDFFCSAFDYVVVGDTNPRGRFLMKRIDLSPDENASEDEIANSRYKHCALKKLIMQTTNRFDWGVKGYDDEDGKRYVDMIRRLSVRKDRKVVWVANNPWESMHSEWRLGGKFTRPLLIRPFGVTQIVPKNYTLPETKLPVLIDHGYMHGLENYTRSAGVEYKLLGHSYGGPAALAQFKAFITIPYQVSTMKASDCNKTDDKIYENLAHGVVTYLPSPTYLKEYFMKQPDELFSLSLLHDTLHVAKDKWYQYIDYYNDDLKDYHYFFDGPEQLKAMLSADNADPKNIRQRGPVFWETMREKSLRDWKKVLDLD